MTDSNTIPFASTGPKDGRNFTRDFTSCRPHSGHYNSWPHFSGVVWLLMSTILIFFCAGSTCWLACSSYVVLFLLGSFPACWSIIGNRPWSSQTVVVFHTICPVLSLVSTVLFVSKSSVRSRQVGVAAGAKKPRKTAATGTGLGRYWEKETWDLSSIMWACLKIWKWGIPPNCSFDGENY